MAIYYFDRNGTTAGFGTLTGAWDTTTASWTTDSTGVAAPTTYTFTSSDESKFGNTGTTATAGTATIAAALTVTINKITTQNLAGLQTIAGSNATTSILNFAGTTPTIDVQSAGGLTISSRISGTDGFTKTGSNALSITNTNNTIDTSSPGSSVNVNAGGLTLNPASSLPNVRSFSITSAINLVYTSDYSIASSTVFSGAGTVWVYRNVGSTALNGITFPSGALVGLTGDTDPSGVGVNAFPTSGLTTYTTDSASQNKVNISINDFPKRVGYRIAGVTTIPNNQIIYAGTGGTFDPQFDLLISYNNANSLASTNEFYNNSTSSALIITRGIKRFGVTASGITFTLRGTGGNPSSPDTYGELQGVITENSFGNLNIAKNDAGRWILSGTNTYAGSSTLTSGTLTITNGSSLGSSASSAATTLTSGTLQIQGGITVNKASSAWALNGSVIENVSGDNVVTAASWTIGTTQSIVVTAGSLRVTNAIAGTNIRTLTKSGTGTLYLSNTASGYLGTVTASAGELQVQNVANAGVACSLGTQATAQATITMGGNTIFTHRGTTADSTDRNITCNGAAFSSLALDSSGTGAGAITLSSGGTLGFSTSGVHTLTFMGNNSATNTCARTIGDAAGGGAVAITKGGGNTWSLTGSITSTGLVTCSNGTLNLGSTNRTFSGGLLVNSTNASPTQIFGIVTITTGNTISANTTMDCGTITAVLTGANTLTVTSSAEEVRPALLRPDDSTNGNNTFTGNATINGCLDIVTPDTVSPSAVGKGRVLGTSNTVTVSSTGIIRTKFTDTSNQRASARYNNLTFQSGSNLKIGYAN